MIDQRVCPFYGGRETGCCHIGRGYISPYHVEIMVRYCISHHEECPRGQAIMKRLCDESDGPSYQSSAPAVSPPC